MTSNLLRLLAALLLCFNLSSGQEPGCDFEGQWHSIGDYFPVPVFPSGLEGNTIYYLCTGTGIVQIGCGLPSIGGYKREHNGDRMKSFSMPFGTTWFLGCEEYECRQDSGWTPTGNPNPACLTTAGVSPTLGNDGSTTTGESSALGNDGSTTFGAYTT